MTFTKDFKKEILDNNFTTDEEKTAFLSAVMRCIGTLHIDSKGVNLELENEFSPLIYKTASIIKQLYNVNLEIDCKTPITGVSIYTLRIPAKDTRIIAQATGFIEYDGEKAVGFSKGIGDFDRGNLKLTQAYLIGLSAGCASITVPHENPDIPNTYIGGYHFEMLFNSEQMADDVIELLADYGITAKQCLRQEDSYSVYIKDSNMLGEYLTLLQASDCVIKLNDIIFARFVRNKVNRMNNCSMANMDKAIEAGQKQYQAIKKIERLHGLDSLPDKLKEIAQIRLENPDYTLDQISEELGGKVGKSGINHRIRKLMEIAEAMEDIDE